MSGKPTLSLRDRFDRHVMRSSDPNGCWLWTASVNHRGYGHFRLNGRIRGAHCVAFELAGGILAHGHLVRHRCDNPPCVNPAHLEAGTVKDNTADMMARGRDGHGSTRGTAHPGHILKDADVAIMRHLRECGVKVFRLAALFGVSRGRASHICRGLGWSHVPRLEYP